MILSDFLSRQIEDDEVIHMKSFQYPLTQGKYYKRTTTIY